jgi:hypothetical protein
VYVVRCYGPGQSAADREGPGLHRLFGADATTLLLLRPLAIARTIDRRLPAPFDLSPRSSL